MSAPLIDVPVRGVRERLLMLRTLSGLSGLDDEGFELLASHATERWVNAGEVLLEQGRPVSKVFVVVEGRVHCLRDGAVTARVENGAAGILALMAGDEQGVEVVAQERTHLLEIPGELLLRVYEENFSFMRNSLRLIAGGLLARRDALPRRAGEHDDVALGEWFDRPRTLVERIIKARSGGILSMVNLDAVIDWARVCREIRLEPGDVLFEAGDPGIFSFFIQYGHVRCTAPDGHSTIVGADFVIGALDPLCNQPRSYSAVAETKVIGLRQDRDDWMTIVETHRELGLKLIGVLSQQLFALQLADASRAPQAPGD